MDYPKQIAITQVECEKLIAQLCIGGLSEAERLAIREQIKEYTKLIQAYASKLPAQVQSTTYFIVTAVVPNCKKANGIRSLIFSTAQNWGARYSSLHIPQDSILYIGDDLHVNVAFELLTHAGSFRNAVLSLVDPPAAMQGISCSINEQGINVGDYILQSHYKPDDSDSPFNSLKCLQHLADSSCSVVTQTNDLFKFQMIENPLHPLLATYKPERAHIVPKRQRGSNTDDNCLALYRVPMHQYFDGIETDGNIPQVKLEPVSVGQVDPSTRRYPVQIAVRCKSRVIFDALTPYMQVGSIFTGEQLTITVTVQVENHAAFCDNLRARACETAISWRDDLDEGEVAVEG